MTDWFKAAFKQITLHLGTRLDAILEAIKAQKPAEFDTRPIVQAVSRVESAIAKQNTDFTADVTIDTSSLEREMKANTSAIKGLKSPDLNTIEAALKLIYSAVDDQKKLIATRLDDVAKAITGLALVSPDTVKLDQQQLRALTGSMAGSAVPSIPQATRISNTTVSAVSAATEYSYTFPSGTVAFLIKTRDQGTLAYYSWTTGKMPAGGDSTTYMTIPQNFLRSQENVDYSGKTIYLGADVANTIFEIEVFRQ